MSLVILSWSCHFLKRYCQLRSIWLHYILILDSVINLYNSRSVFMDWIWLPIGLNWKTCRPLLFDINCFFDSFSNQFSHKSWKTPKECINCCAIQWTVDSKFVTWAKNSSPLIKERMSYCINIWNWGVVHHLGNSTERTLVSSQVFVSPLLSPDVCHNSTILSIRIESRNQQKLISKDMNILYILYFAKCCECNAKINGIEVNIDAFSGKTW